MMQSDQLWNLRMFVAEHRDGCGWGDPERDPLTIHEERFDTFRAVTARCDGCGETMTAQFSDDDIRIVDEWWATLFMKGGA
jgi:hypothetical protein